MFLSENGVGTHVIVSLVLIGVPINNGVCESSRARG